MRLVMTFTPVQVYPTHKMFLYSSDSVFAYVIPHSKISYWNESYKCKMTTVIVPKRDSHLDTEEAHTGIT